MKSLPVPVAAVRKNFSDVVAQAHQGDRIRVTRHGRTVAWIIGAEDHQKVASEKKPKSRSNAPRRR